MVDVAATFYTKDFLKLERDNWTEWDAKLRSLLQVKDVEALLDPPADPNNVPAAEANNRRRIFSRIKLNLSAHYLLQVSQCGDCAEAYGILKENFRPTTKLSVFGAKAAFFTIEYEKFNSIQFGNLGAHIHREAMELNKLRDPADGKVISDEDMLVVMYGALKNQPGFRSTLKDIDKWPAADKTWKNVVKALLNDERDYVKKNSARSFLTNAEPDTCKFYKLGKCFRNQDECSYSHGSGPTLQRSAQEEVGDVSVKDPKKKDLSKIACHYCKRLGHLKKDCLKLKAKRAEEQATQDDQAAAQAAATQEYNADFSFLAFDVDLRHVPDVHVPVAEDLWISDDGSTRTLSKFKPDGMHKLKSPIRILAAGGRIIEAWHEGTVLLKTSVHGSTKRVSISNVLWVPQLRFSLISISQFDSKGAAVIHRRGQVQFCMDKEDGKSTPSLK